MKVMLGSPVFVCQIDTIDIMATLVSGMDHKLLRYKNLITDNGLDTMSR